MSDDTRTVEELNTVLYDILKCHDERLNCHGPDGYLELAELARRANDGEEAKREAAVLRRALEMACVWTGCAWCPISNECDPVVTPCADAVRDHAMAEARKELGL